MFLPKSYIGKNLVLLPIAKVGQNALRGSDCRISKSVISLEQIDEIV